MENFKRREFIKLSALGFAAVALQLNSITSFAQIANGHYGKWNPNTKLNWDAFLERIATLAKTQHQLPWDQKAYTQQVKKLLLQCNFPEFENVKKEFENYKNTNPDLFEVSNLHHEIDFQVSLFQFEKGEYIPHHDHPDMTGVINVVSGNMHLKNYTIEQQLEGYRKTFEHGRENFNKTCLIREIENEIAKAGDVSILTAHEGNIHSLMPNEFTQMVDVFTPAYKPDTNGTWYKVNEEGFYQKRENIYEAEYVVSELSKVQAIAIDSSLLDCYVGIYAFVDDYTLVVTKSNDKLYIQEGVSLNELGEKVELLPYEANKFWPDKGNNRCEFNLGEERKAQSMKVYYAEIGELAKRIK